MRVSEILNLNIPDNDLNVDRLERYLAKEMEKFRKQVFGKVLQQIEEKELAEAKGRVSCREKVPRCLFTRLGLKNNQLLNTTVKRNGIDNIEKKC